MTVIRRYMQPIPPDIARTWHKRLTIAYLFFAFNTFVCTVYMVNQYNPKRKRLQQGDRGIA